jgi:hypothetical protein
MRSASTNGEKYRKLVAERGISRLTTGFWIKIAAGKVVA